METNQEAKEVLKSSTDAGEARENSSSGFFSMIVLTPLLWLLVVLSALVGVAVLLDVTGMHRSFAEALVFIFVAPVTIAGWALYIILYMLSYINKT